ncbi:hypothetical protein [Candidatus Uabimicrobium sp. HlEnr_7]|uniref:hypothetical protein n=1 Tax=Candidatus Uabimicrobium helgolandensis TaxID=3095367 RepID=UPI003557F4FA
MECIRKEHSCKISVIKKHNRYWFIATDNGIYMSTISGENIKYIFQTPAYDLLIDKSGFLFVATDKGVLVSISKGDSWKALVSGIIANGLVFSDEDLLIGTNNGIVRYSFLSKSHYFQNEGFNTRKSFFINDFIFLRLLPAYNKERHLVNVHIQYHGQ